MYFIYNPGIMKPTREQAIEAIEILKEYLQDHDNTSAYYTNDLIKYSDIILLSIAVNQENIGCYL